MTICFKKFRFALGFDIFITHITLVIHSPETFFKLSFYKMNIKTNFLEDYVNFVDATKETK